MRPQAFDHLFRRQLRSAARLQPDVESAGVAAVERYGNKPIDVGAGTKHVGHLLLNLDHAVKRDILRGFGGSGEDAGVLAGYESLRHKSVKIDRGHERADRRRAT